jgi:hypothetical protein
VAAVGIRRGGKMKGVRWEIGGSKEAAGGGKFH